jgi:hypothetical protein
MIDLHLSIRSREGIVATGPRHHGAKNPRGQVVGYLVLAGSSVAPGTA